MPLSKGTSNTFELNGSFLVQIKAEVLTYLITNFELLILRTASRYFFTGKQFLIWIPF